MRPDPSSRRQHLRAVSGVRHAALRLSFLRTNVPHLGHIDDLYDLYDLYDLFSLDALDLYGQIDRRSV